VQHLRGGEHLAGGGEGALITCIGSDQAR
jgi:hypothetical protein